MNDKKKIANKICDSIDAAFEYDQYVMYSLTRYSFIKVAMRRTTHMKCSIALVHSTVREQCV